MRLQRLLSLTAALAALAPHAATAQANRPILAVFAHPDDERVIGPLLSRLAREGRETHLVIATDGSQGTRDYAKIPAGAQLAAARTKEATCAANRLGVKQLHIVGLLDGGLASFETLGKLRTAIAAIIDSVKPAAIITFGPEGGTGHPDHRLTGNVTTQVVQADPRLATSIDLLYASLPTERLRTAPRANPTVTGMAEAARQDFNGTGVRTTLISPGMVETPGFSHELEGTLTAEDIARAVMFAVAQPPHVDVNEILIRPTAQSS